ncbi:DNA-binding transcriptional regulator KdgR [Erwinia sp. OLTSP20]|uniref:DNA-binding transcriptional regulator KdgR n=1 Tax=unclassified Erwinia TaxID=2622719 RepID=UPI000C1A18A8|nr:MULTISPECIES: DNA-binding transcriptional regulator KdgR [unclassified Erwinia]PIJ51435.1 DNA-binding transcriptional regulator KdgR [Erwinia sp. OAMSP11]PIJ73457.1 DNA-binding transcriptional regulator KdgR [Erwinia sp. OLSSP12]PIJ85520.1 DNA-binding transcriptional regulator KdgR [Erwinia sp. OLCASP19]PIJ85918.1 DNA-binding transcriptional regulator KdgR [Erwinia sp. OLMTSP26]PIJ87399.1 DNA-binding transcriptional regulator KdgR [Erwinia sp. OLMDSP33]
MPAPDHDKQPDAVSSVVKVFAILQALGEAGATGITELAQRVGMSKSTVYRFVQTMKAQGYVSQQGETEKYRLTLKLFELGSASLQQLDLIRLADAEMRELSRLTHETIHLGALDHDSIIYIHKIDSLYNLQMYSRIGRRNPLYSTAIGKVLLAWRPRGEVTTLLSGVTFIRHTQRTLTDTDALLAVLEQVNRQGYAEDNEEQERGIRCLAVPVFDRFDRVIAGVSLSFPSLRFDQQQKASYISMLHNAGRNLSAQLGCHHYPW